MKSPQQNAKQPGLFNFTKSKILLLILLISTASCVKKEDIEKDPPEKYMISFKANGVLQEFTSEHSPKFGITDSERQHTAVVHAARPASWVGIQALDVKPITAKTYSGYTVVNTAAQAKDYEAGASMQYEDGSIYYISPYLPDRDMTVQILEMTSKIMRGTFKGTLKSLGKPDLIITDGKFNVPIGELSPS